MSTATSGFRINRVTVRNGEFTYSTFRLTGWLNGKRIRKQFLDRQEALGEKNRLEVQAANLGKEIQAVNTRLTVEQVAEAEGAFRRLEGRPLAEAVDWYLRTYKPPVTPTPVETAVAAFIADRTHHCRSRQLVEYTNVLGGLAVHFANRPVHTVTTTEINDYMVRRGTGPKRWNNLRGDFAALFNFCRKAPQAWCADNPVDGIRKYEIARGVPEILTADVAASLMAFVEEYKGGPRSPQPKGCLVPFFALSLFAGIRPSLREGELIRIAKDPAKFIKLDTGVIRLSPEASKVNAVRQIKIRDNLRAWLEKYPPERFPIVPSNVKRLIAGVRTKFKLTHDVLRHSFVSAHVAKFRSLGDCALEAGNSEAIIRRHYLNLMSEAEADRFWSILPSGKT